jgi:hypothetical protein
MARAAEEHGLRGPHAYEASPWAVAWLRTLLAVVFLGAFPYLHRINNPNENVRVYMTMAIVDSGTFRVDEQVELFGHTNDLARAPDASGAWHRYSVKAPATSYAGVPVYAAFRAIAPRFGLTRPTLAATALEREAWLRGAIWALRFFTVQLPCFVALLAFERWLRRVSRDAVLRYATVLAAGLGTNHLASSLLFASHAPVAWATFGSFALVLGVARPRPGRAFLAGVFAGLATLLEYHALPMSVMLALVATVRYRRLVPLAAFGAGAATQALALMGYQWRAYGNPLTPGHKLCESQEFASAHAKGLFGIELPDPVAFRELSLNRTFGFFTTSPFMFLGLAALAMSLFSVSSRSRRWRAHLGAGFAIMLALWLAVSAFVSWRGGWTIGPRFFGAAPPFFAFFALVGLEVVAARGATWRTSARAVAGGLALAGVLSLGLVGLFVSSLPEGVERPFVDVVVPFTLAGLAPHHLAELVGIPGFRPFFLVVAALVGAGLWPLVVGAGERLPRALARFALAMLVLGAGLVPALLPNANAESVQAARDARTFYAQYWEPEGGSRMHELAKRREQGAASACDLTKLARLEGLFGHDDRAQGAREEAARRGGCSAFLQRF